MKLFSFIPFFLYLALPLLAGDAPKPEPLQQAVREYVHCFNTGIPWLLNDYEKNHVIWKLYVYDPGLSRTRNSRPDSRRIDPLPAGPLLCHAQHQPALGLLELHSQARGYHRGGGLYPRPGSEHPHLAHGSGHGERSGRTDDLSHALFGNAAMGPRRTYAHAHPDR